MNTKAFIPIPEYLYHYTSLEGTLGILETQELWMSHISTLNDPSELKHGISIFFEALNEITKTVIKNKEKNYKQILFLGDFVAKVGDIFDEYYRDIAISYCKYYLPEFEKLIENIKKHLAQDEIYVWG